MSSLKKIRQAAGFILLESLVSLSLLVFVLGVTLPLTVQLVSHLQAEQIEVEIKRVLYDLSKNRGSNISVKETIHSHELNLITNYTEDQLTVKELNSGRQNKLEIESIEWEK